MERLARTLTQAPTFSQLDDAYGPTDSSLEEAFLCPFASSGLWWDTCAMTLADTTCHCSSLNPYIAVIRAGSFPSLFEVNEIIGPSAWPLS